MSKLETLDTEIASHLADVQERIHIACARAGRTSADITLIAVTKRFPAEIVRKACALGLTHMGENRVQELIEKFEDGRLSEDCPGLCVHLIGHLQSNKVRKAVQLAATVDSVDSSDLAEQLNHTATGQNKLLRVLVEVNTSGEPQKFGVQPEETLELVERMLPLSGLQVAGLMTVGPNVSDPAAIRAGFRALSPTVEQIQTRRAPPCWSVLSMGMSGD
jgi:PLP dependent protein